MSMFKGLLNNASTEYHTFVTADEILGKLNLSNYSSSSLSGYLLEASGEIISALKETSLSTAHQKLTGMSTSNNLNISILKFNTDTKKYELKTGSEIFENEVTDLSELLKKHDLVQNGSGNAAGIKRIISNIQNSYSGCIIFKPSLNVGLDSATSIPITPLIKLYFQDKRNRSDERVIGQKGAPLISAIARRPTGGKYSVTRSNSHAASGTGLGVYLKPYEGDIENPKNTIGAQLRLSYNKALGYWESGTQQILARLLTDLDPAPISDVADLDGIDNVGPDDLYDIDSNNYMSGFTAGIALPLTVHNGNPYTFGPNIITRLDKEKKKEKIRVVNRAPRKFKKGDVVLCSLIDNEWIVQGFDSADTSKASPTIKAGKWSFTKFFTDSDSFFKDQRFYETSGASYTQNISPDIYESKTRIKFYKHLNPAGGGEDSAPALDTSISNLSSLNDLSKISKLNINILLPADLALTQASPALSTYDFQPSKRYVQATIFDHLGTHMGGKSSKNLIERTNIIKAPNGLASDASTGLTYYRSLGIFWGTVFPDGYSSSQVAKLKATTSNTITSAKLTNSPFFTTGSNTSNLLSTSSDKNRTLSADNFMFADSTDLNLRQLPAEAALNGSLSGKYSYPIENITLLEGYQYEGNIVNGYAHYLSDSGRLNWLCNSGNFDDPIYGLDPVQPSRIQFSPLTAEVGLFPFSGSFSQARYITELFSGAAVTPADLWGSTFARRTYAAISYGTGVKGPSETPFGGPRLFPLDNNGREKANFVGVIAAKNKFLASKGASIVCTTKQFFGLNTYVSIAGGQVTNLSVVGGFLFGGDKNAIQQNSSPQWGSSSDNYDSFGTTALHVRVFDSWPDEQTIYDGRYFAVLHFNPLPIGMNVKTTIFDSGKTYSKTWSPQTDYKKYNTSTLASIEYQHSVDKIETSVDFRVPTYGHPSNSIDNTVVPTGVVIKKDGCYNGGSFVAVLRPEEEWIINPIRRGQLLTGGGFRYYQRTIGLDFSNYSIKNGGINYSVGDLINFPKYGQAIVSSIGTSGAISKIQEVTDSSGNYKNGEGYISSDFENGVVSSSSQSSSNGNGATIVVNQGKVYEILKHDLGPQDRLKDTKRLTLGSNRGTDVAQGELNTVLGLEENSDGKYDAFYFFHNDVLHTILFEATQVPGFAQYVILEVGTA